MIILHVTLFLLLRVGTTVYIKPDDWALWMTRLGVRNLSKPGDMGGQLRSLASHEMLVRVGRTVPGAAQWLRMSCTPALYTLARQWLYTCTHCVHTWLTMGCCLVSQTWALLSRDLALARITFPTDWEVSLKSKITLNTETETRARVWYYRLKVTFYKVSFIVMRTNRLWCDVNISYPVGWFAAPSPDITLTRGNLLWPVPPCGSGDSGLARQLAQGSSHSDVNNKTDIIRKYQHPDQGLLTILGWLSAIIVIQ